MVSFVGITKALTQPSPVYGRGLLHRISSEGGSLSRIRERVRVRALMTATFLFIPLQSFACDIERLPFGASIEEMASKYRLNTLGASIDKESQLVARGSQFCQELPKDSTAEFTFIYGQLVQLKLTRPDSKDTLLNFAKAHFTMPETKEGQPKGDSILFEPDNSTRTAIYKMEPYGINQEQEVLAVISKTHDELFKRIANAEKKNIVKD